MSNSDVEQELVSRDARLDFENALQGILEKANAEERIPTDQEDEKDSSNEDSTKRLKTASSPQKPLTPKTGKKRRRREERRDEIQKASPYIVKLFDRSVDLASFTDDTPLYPICRAWMQNDPYKKNAHRLLNGNNSEQTDVLDSSDDEASSSVVHKIPRPNEPWNNIGDDGKFKSPRIPDLVPQPSGNLDMKNGSDAPVLEALRRTHLEHWKKVRRTWKAKSMENDLRYKDGMNTLRDIFLRTSCVTDSAS